MKTLPHLAAVTLITTSLAVINSSCAATGLYAAEPPLAASTVAPLGFVTSGPATIGMVFREGDLPGTAHVVTHNKTVTAQIDPLVRWPDGSLKFARITVAQAGRYVVVPGGSAHAKPRSMANVILPNFKVEIKTANGTLVQSLRRMKFHRQGCGALLCLLSLPATPLVVEATGKPTPHLALRAWVWSYPTLGTSQIVATVENTWAQTAADNVAMRDIRFVLNDKTVYQQRNVTIWRWSRTRPVRVWTGRKVSDHAMRNLAYLRATGAVPNYNPRLRLAADAVSLVQARYDRSPRGLMGHTIVDPHMADTGGRPDIGPIPKWDVLALLTNNPQALDIARAVDDSSAAWPIHLRSTLTDKPLSPERYPHAMLQNRFIAGNPVPCWQHNCRIRYPKEGIPLLPNVAHEPAMNYVPYLLTADPFYLGELEFWNDWNALSLNAGYREGSKVIFLNIHSQARAMAWQLRTLSYLLFVLPQDSARYKYWSSVLRHNRHAVMRHWIEHRRLPVPILPGKYGAYYNRTHGGMTPGQQDFLTWSFANTVRLGFHKWLPILRWNTGFVVQRLTNPNICPQLASLYIVKYYYRGGRGVGRWPDMVRAALSEKWFRKTLRMPANLLSLPCDSPALARALHVPRAGDFAGYPASPQGFVAHMQPAIAAAVDAGIAGAVRAWKIYQKRPTKQNYSRYPNWDIVPMRRPFNVNASQTTRP